MREGRIGVVSSLMVSCPRTRNQRPSSPYMFSSTTRVVSIVLMKLLLLPGSFVLRLVEVELFRLIEIERLLRFGGRESELELDMRCRYAFGKRQAAEFLQGLEVAGGPGQAPVIGLALRSQCRGGQDVEQGLQGRHQRGVGQQVGLLKGGLGDACVLVAA